MPEKIKRFRISIYGVLISKGHVLLTETRGKSGVDFVNFPGGGIARGEEPASALVREFKEETGLVVRPVQIIHASMAFHRSFVKPDRQLFGTYWLVERLKGKLNEEGNGDDVKRCFWATKDELADLPFTTFDREVLPELMARMAEF
ncbi:MAG: NUDIX hydrolase [Deltaproteobacteria bacterium]|nr:NUDIX hydrolase [Deltaproteobacteria bacterium]